MLTIAYLANQFPAAVEPYVNDEIHALRRVGIRVLTSSVKNVSRQHEQSSNPHVVLCPLHPVVLARATWLCFRRWSRISAYVRRIAFCGSESPIRRIKALLHTILGACYAVRLQGQEVDHIHVHHGFSASWIAMVAAGLLGTDFSMTLHGSDLLVHRAYLDVKLQHCKFCVTISEYNRSFLAKHCPEIESSKIVVARLGVKIPDEPISKKAVRSKQGEPFRILTVGRLHRVKDHAFLVRACARLREQGLNFSCQIAGEGPERHRLQSLIRELGLQDRITLLGHMSPEQTDCLYTLADLVVLTSRSEGIPLVLMEAMARGKLVLAPAITGIPELVIAGKTGFLYEPGSMRDFINQLMKAAALESFAYTQSGDQREETLDPESAISHHSVESLQWMRHAARVQVSQNFNREKNLQLFIDLFLDRVIAPKPKDLLYARSLLQQI